MNAKYSYVNLFQSPVHVFDIDEFDKLQDDLIDHVYKLKKQDPNGHIISNRNGWQSKGFDSPLSAAKATFSLYSTIAARNSLLFT